MPTFEDFASHKDPIAIVGLGYVGLPLAVALSQKFSVIGFDISPARIDELKSNRDHTREVTTEKLSNCGITFTSDPGELRKAPLIIIAVPTPIDTHRRPDLAPIISATQLVGKNMAPGSIVVYESTVYPGLTEEICVPLLEEESGETLGTGFGVGYSPERINPGDKVHTLESITKIVSGSDPQVTRLLAKIYGSVIKAGIYEASSIKVAEAAKVIENTQRDVNIALMNELAIVFEKMGIDTQEVLRAAGTKWNFLPFKPGLVGGHCIGVDPYYLTFKAEELGFHPEVILAGRRINDRMGRHVAHMAIKRLIRDRVKINEARVGVLGLTFKENVPDLRNTRVVDLIEELQDYGATVLVNDPEANPAEAAAKYGIELHPLSDFRNLDALILAVGHSAYETLEGHQLKKLFGPKSGFVLDVKGFFAPVTISEAGLKLYRL